MIPYILSLLHTTPNISTLFTKIYVAYHLTSPCHTWDEVPYQFESRKSAKLYTTKCKCTFEIVEYCINNHIDVYLGEKLNHIEYNKNNIFNRNLLAGRYRRDHKIWPVKDSDTYQFICNRLIIKKLHQHSSG